MGMALDKMEQEHSYVRLVSTRQPARTTYDLRRTDEASANLNLIEEWWQSYFKHN